MGTGSYIGFQISQIFHTGIRAGGSIKDDSDRKGERGGWIHGIFAFIFVGVFRAALAVVLIPLHAIFALCQAKQTTADIVTRVIVLAAFAIAAWVGTHQIRGASQRQLNEQNLQSNSSVSAPFTSPVVPAPPQPNTPPVTGSTGAGPSFYTKGKYYIVVASPTVLADAQRISADVKSKGYDSEIFLSRNGHYGVTAGYLNLGEAKRLMATAVSAGHFKGPYLSSGTTFIQRLE